MITARLTKINEGRKSLQRGFTLIELLVVIGILAILLSIVLIAINPARQFSQANDTKRQSDVQAVLNAVNEYMADNKGVLPGGGSITATPTDIKSGGTVDLCTVLVTKYLAAMPADPTNGTYTDCTNYDTGYNISVSATDNRVTVSAPHAEISTPISVTR